MIQLNYRDAKPIYEQIKDGMRHLVISNALTADEKLPSVRELAATLAINPNTIQRAYRDLEKEGYVYTISGKGTFVAAQKHVKDARTVELKGHFAVSGSRAGAVETSDNGTGRRRRYS